MRILYALGAAALGILFAGETLAAVTTIDFTEPEFPGGNIDASNQFATYGVIFSDAYFYIDSRDTFDGQGVSNGNLSDLTMPGATGRIDFGGTTDFFAFDWWALFGTMYVNAYDASGTLLDQFVSSPPTDDPGITGSAVLNGTGISYVTWHDFGGFVQLSTISYDLGTAPIPLPATLPLLAGALGIGGFLARRQGRKSLPSG